MCQKPNIIVYIHISLENNILNVTGAVRLFTDSHHLVFLLHTLLLPVLFLFLHHAHSLTASRTWYRVILVINWNYWFHFWNFINQRFAQQSTLKNMWGCAFFYAVLKGLKEKTWLRAFRCSSQVFVNKTKIWIM